MFIETCHESCKSSSHPSLPCNLCPGHQLTPSFTFLNKHMFGLFLQSYRCYSAIYKHNNNWHKILVITLIITKWNVVHRKRPLWRPRCKWKGRICTCNTILMQAGCFSWNIRRMCGTVLCCCRRTFSFLPACDVFLENCEIIYFIAYACHVDSELLK